MTTNDYQCYSNLFNYVLFGHIDIIMTNCCPSRLVFVHSVGTMVLSHYLMADFRELQVLDVGLGTRYTRIIIRIEACHMHVHNIIQISISAVT